MLTAMRAIGLLVCVAALMVTTAGLATAQNVRTSVQHPAGLTRLLVDSPALIQVGTTGTPARPTYVYQPAGRFQLWTGTDVPAAGSPLIAGDENRRIASVDGAVGTWDLTDFTSKITVSIDGTRYDPYLQMYQQTADVDPANLPDFFTQDVSAGTRDVSGEVLIPLTGNVPAQGTPNVRLRFTYTLVHDGLMLEFVIRNDDTVAHGIGIRAVIDALFGSTTRDGTAIILDNGTVLTAETLIPDPTNPQVGMPETWVSHDHFTDPLISVRGTIEAAEVHDPGTASQSAGTPDSIAFGQLRNMGNNYQWDFQPNPRASITDEDWAYAVRWDERSLQPGQSRRYVTYYGLGAAAVDYDPPYALAAYAPASLSVTEGDDPATPEVESFYLTDSSGSSVFEVVAAIDNFGTSPLSSATARISLPPGLELYPDTQPRTISLGTVVRNQAPLPMARWQVRAQTTRPGTAEIEITGPLGKVVRRQISIPAIPVVPPRDSALGLEMLSIPYSFINSDASNVLGSLSDSVYPGGPVAIWRYHPSRQEYRTYPDPFAASIEPGEGFWLLNQNRETIVLPSDATPVAAMVPYDVELLAGWNQIGNPFVAPIRFDQVDVIGPDGSQWGIQEATARGLILPVLYSYDPVTNEYVWSTTLAGTSLIPFEGYWLLAYRDVTLVFPPPGGMMVAEVPATAATQPQDGWQVGIQVQASGQTRAARLFGATSGATDEVDTSDVPAPPALLATGPRVDAWFSIGADSDRRYLVDTRSADPGAKTWSLTVLAEEPGAAVTVRWPGLSQTLPGDLVATLQDVAAGRQVYMRTSESYTFTSQAGGTRELRITVRQRAEATLGLTAAARSTARGGLEILYTLGNDALVDVEVRNIAGRVVRSLAQNRAAVEGQNTLMWNGLSEAGTAVPAGTYIVQVTARSPETGEQMSVIRTATVSR